MASFNGAGQSPGMAVSGGPFPNQIHSFTLIIPNMFLRDDADLIVEFSWSFNGNNDEFGSIDNIKVVTCTDTTPSSSPSMRPTPSPTVSTPSPTPSTGLLCGTVSFNDARAAPIEATSTTLEDGVLVKLLDSDGTVVATTSTVNGDYCLMAIQDYQLPIR